MSSVEIVERFSNALVVKLPLHIIQIRNNFFVTTVVITEIPQVNALSAQILA